MLDDPLYMTTFYQSVTQSMVGSTPASSKTRHYVEDDGPHVAEVSVVAVHLLQAEHIIRGVPCDVLLLQMVVVIGIGSWSLMS